MKYVYVVNRFNFKEKTESIIKTLTLISEKFNRDYEFIINDSIDDAIKLKERFKNTKDIITSVGGDGSINLILNDLVNTDNILAFIPYGTGNDFNRVFMQEYDNGIHELDIVRINNRYFINVACFGIDADIANDDRYIHNKWIPESMRYNAGVVHHFLTYKGRKMKVEYDGKSIEQYFTTVVVANAKYYGGGYKVAPNSLMDDGLLDVYLVDKLNKINMAKIILSMKDAGHLNNPSLKAFKTDKIIITSDHPFKANIDGESLESDRFEIEVINKGIKVDFNSDFIKEFIKNK